VNMQARKALSKAKRVKMDLTFGRAERAGRSPEKRVADLEKHVLELADAVADLTESLGKRAGL
jgi:hypothetical protein